jgi:hypothetical protein
MILCLIEVIRQLLIRRSGLLGLLDGRFPGSRALLLGRFGHSGPFSGIKPQFGQYLAINFSGKNFLRNGYQYLNITSPLSRVK